METFENRLRKSKYPGRGIVIGMTPDGNSIVHVYWIMGRSENSRNRVFEYSDDTLRTRAFDETRLIDPSLVIYNAMRVSRGMHIVTNGDQTDTICEFLEKGLDFREALDTREFEPDVPNFTPRISGISDEKCYSLSILKTIGNDRSRGQRNYFGYSGYICGIGHCITTYTDDGSPLPSFAGEPYPVGLLDDIGENAMKFWSLLDEGNRVSLAVKHIRTAAGRTDIRIINRNGEAL